MISLVNPYIKNYPVFRWTVEVRRGATRPAAAARQLGEDMNEMYGMSASAGISQDNSVLNYYPDSGTSGLNYPGLYKSGYLIPTSPGICKSRHLIPTYPGLSQSTFSIQGYPRCPGCCFSRFRDCTCACLSDLAAQAVLERCPKSFAMNFAVKIFNCLVE